MNAGPLHAISACAPVPVLPGGLRERHVEGDLETGVPVTPDVRRRAKPVVRSTVRTIDCGGPYERAAGAGSVSPPTIVRAGAAATRAARVAPQPRARHAVVVGEEHDVGRGLPRARVPRGGQPRFARSGRAGAACRRTTASTAPPSTVPSSTTSTWAIRCCRPYRTETAIERARPVARRNDDAVSHAASSSGSPSQAIPNRARAVAAAVGGCSSARSLGNPSVTRERAAPTVVGAAVPCGPPASGTGTTNRHRSARTTSASTTTRRQLRPSRRHDGRPGGASSVRHRRPPPMTWRRRAPSPHGSPLRACNDSSPSRICSTSSLTELGSTTPLRSRPRRSKRMQPGASPRERRTPASSPSRRLGARTRGDELTVVDAVEGDQPCGAARSRQPGAPYRVEDGIAATSRARQRRCSPPCAHRPIGAEQSHRPDELDPVGQIGL